MSTLYNGAMKIEMLADYIRTRLDLDAFADMDVSLNGLQVGRPDKEVKRVVCAVDASLATFAKAAEMGADALFVHHGLFWGKPIAVTGMHYARLALLLRADIALLAAHLPLDAHPVLGNNATMARLLDLEAVTPFGLYHGRHIGFRGTFKSPVTVGDIVRTLGLSEETGLHVLPFGKKHIRSVGIISGGAAFEVQEAISLGLDAYITGESSHTMHPFCQESGITMICGGHYATEVFGVQSMAKDLADNLGLESSFVALPTAL
jgi:dinuclear metal center YbgI/SA1388 family protein